MKIRIEMTVEVDPKAWAAEYGLELDVIRTSSTKAVREDVKEFCIGQVANSYAAVDANLLKVVKAS